MLSLGKNRHNKSVFFFLNLSLLAERHRIQAHTWTATKKSEIDE